MEENMSRTLVDAAFYGRALRAGRRSAHLNRADMAKILKISRDVLVRIENGKMLPSNDLIKNIFTESCIMLWAKNYKKINN